jgi:hypothetical protein
MSLWDKRRSSNLASDAGVFAQFLRGVITALQIMSLSVFKSYPWSEYTGHLASWLASIMAMSSIFLGCI